MTITRRDILKLCAAGAVICLLGLAISHHPCEEVDGSLTCEVAP